MPRLDLMSICVPEQQAGGVDVSAGAGTRSVAATASSGGAGKDYPETRLQVRLPPGGPPMQKTFPSTASLTEVSEWVASETLSVDVGNVVFTTRFPNKTFGASDFGKSFKELGLTPSAILFVAS